MNLTLRENYWDSPELKREFIRFTHEIHGLDLSLWDTMGFWDSKYRPFSFFEGGRLISNVCVYSMDMSILGRRRRVGQISAVATLPEFRRKGLNSELTRIDLDWARDTHDFFFLFADEDAFSFYHHCGFRPADEHKSRIHVVGRSAVPGATELDVEKADHLGLIYGLASHREPVSNVLGVFNEKLFMFWCLYSLRNYICYIAALDALVLFKRERGLVTVYDIVATGMPSFVEIYPYICDPADEAVEFLFMVDRLELGSIDHVKVEGNGIHILGTFPLENSRLIFPFTAHA